MTGVHIPAGAMMAFFSYLLPRSGRLWGLLTLLFNGYQGLLPRG